MITRILAFFLLFAFVISCNKKTNPEISSEDIKENIMYLASDSLKGRKPGKEGDMLASGFIREKLRDAGLQLIAEKGFQPFKVITEVGLGEKNTFNVGGKEFLVQDGFLPYSFSANAGVTGNAVFAGYGFKFEKGGVKYNDYEGIDVEGKWVLLLKGDPEMDNQESIFIEFSDERSKVLTALDQKAAGVLLVGGAQYNSKDELSPLFYDKNSSTYPIPVIQVTREVANSILQPARKNIEGLEELLAGEVSGKGFQLDIEVTANVDVVHKVVESQNVVGVVPGNDPALMNEYVVIGAHHDHLGMGGQGSGSRAVDTIAVHNGADDNASGVAAVIELAEKVAGERLNKRSIVFTTFGAEEMGLVGSKAFTNNPPVDLEKVVAMVNFDMVGRLDTIENSLSIGGVNTSLETREIIERLNPGFNLALSDDGYGPSDHSSFYAQGIPVFFVSTGAHADYHTPEDDVGYINFEGQEKVVKYFYDVVMEVANRQEALTYNESGSMQRSGRGGRFKVTLGVMPDFAGIEKRGLRIDAVTKGKPAHKGGMVKGDIITALDGMKVGNIYDYMNRLKALEPGQNITVDVIRDDKVEVLIVQL